MGFSPLSEDKPVETVATMVNRYLDVCSSCIADHGGEVSKYIGDSVMAYFEHRRPMPHCGQGWRFSVLCTKSGAGPLPTLRLLTFTVE